MKFSIKFILSMMFMLALFIPNSISSFAKSTDINFVVNEVNKNIEFRNMLGFMDNQESVIKIMKDMDSVKVFDYYLTEEEEQELIRRIDFQTNEVGKIQEALIGNKLEDKIGAFYINQKEGGVLKIGITTDLPLT